MAEFTSGLLLLFAVYVAHRTFNPLLVIGGIAALALCGKGLVFQWGLEVLPVVWKALIGLVFLCGAQPFYSSLILAATLFMFHAGHRILHKHKPTPEQVMQAQMQHHYKVIVTRLAQQQVGMFPLFFLLIELQFRQYDVEI